MLLLRLMLLLTPPKCLISRFNPALGHRLLAACQALKRYRDTINKSCPSFRYAASGYSQQIFLGASLSKFKIAHEGL